MVEKPDIYDPVLLDTSKDQPAKLYSRAGKLPSHKLVISPRVQVAQKRSFDLAVIRRKQTLKIDDISGWIIRNKFSTITRVQDYGIVSRYFFAGVIRYDEPGKIFQVREETIECETLKDETVFDVYLSFDGMIGTNSKGGSAGFNIGISVAWEDKLKLLSEKDAIRELGAKDCKGRGQLLNNVVAAKGTRLTFVVHYEMNVTADGTPMSVSEVHFEESVNNFFKIVTR